MAREEEHNNGKHLDRIIAAQVCEKHHSPQGNPCWWIQSAHGYLRAICNDRALAYGARGEVTPYQKPVAPNSKKKEHIR
jgi:hypothetical protein